MTLENVKIPPSKSYINSYACRLTEPTFGAEITTSKKAVFWTLQFQFNCGTYPIRQLSSLKLPMDSQSIQTTSSKSISVLNVRTDFPIYIAKQSGTLTKMLKWCFAWQCEYGCLPLHIEIQILLQKYLFYNDCLDSSWSIKIKN